MATNNGLIYIRQHIYYNNDKICKLGKSKNIPDRDNCYATGEYIRGYFTLVIVIFDNQKYDDTYVEKLLQRYFKNYHSKKNGGSEFYQFKIIDEIVSFLNKTIIQFKVLTDEEINNLISKERIKNLKPLLKKLILNKQLKKPNERDRLQNEYVKDILDNLDKYNKVLVKAPTGFGKTIVMYKTINKLPLLKILIFTPRLNLNKQFIEQKYTKHLNINYVYKQYSTGYDKSNDPFKFNEDVIYKSNLIKDISKSNENIILLSCYQSRKSLIKNIIVYNLTFDLVIFDEAHFISSWQIKTTDEKIFLLTNNEYFKNRIFTTATPVDVMILNKNIFGNLVEKIKIYELVNNQILCNIETIIKKLDNKKHEYSDLSKLIEKSIILYNKRKGIVYVNDCKNAENLYNIMKKNNIIKPYLYISKDIDDIDSEKEKEDFETTPDKAVIIAVGKIGYGYDNENVDFICFGDPRTSDIDIRQIIGRGLRWNKLTYPDKILHILVPCYKNELDNYDDNKALDTYLNYIISEYGNDDISKIIINYDSIKNNHDNTGKKYDGEDIPIEIYKNWCTTGHNMYSKFMIFLKLMNVYNEQSYNKLYELNNDWMINLGDIQTKYPKFCFRHIHPLNIDYYWTKKEALDAYEISNNKLMIEYGKDKYRKLMSCNKLKKINKLDNKIPIINFDLYYPKD